MTAPRYLLAVAMAVSAIFALAGCSATHTGAAERFQRATCATRTALSIVEVDDRNEVDIATLHLDYSAARLALIRQAKALASQPWPAEVQRNVSIVEQDALEQALQFDSLQHGLWEGPGDVPGPSPGARTAIVTIRAMLHLTGDEPCGS